MSYKVANPEDRISLDAAQIILQNPCGCRANDYKSAPLTSRLHVIILTFYEVSVYVPSLTITSFRPSLSRPGNGR